MRTGWEQWITSVGDNELFEWNIYSLNSEELISECFSSLCFRGSGGRSRLCGSRFSECLIRRMSVGVEVLLGCSCPRQRLSAPGLWTCSGLGAPRLRPSYSWPLGWASEPQGRGVGHCVEWALAEARLKQTTVGCLTASQVQRRRPFSGTRLLRKPVFSRAVSRKSFPPFKSAFISLTITFSGF